MAKIADIKIETSKPVKYQASSKIMQLVANYTDCRIRVYTVPNGDINGEYIYDLYIDGSNKYMKKKPLKSEIQNIENFINGIIYTMNSF